MFSCPSSNLSFEMSNTNDRNSGISDIWNNSYIFNSISSVSIVQKMFRPSCLKRELKPTIIEVIASHPHPKCFGWINFIHSVGLLCSHKWTQFDGFISLKDVLPTLPFFKVLQYFQDFFGNIHLSYPILNFQKRLKEKMCSNLWIAIVLFKLQCLLRVITV